MSYHLLVSPVWVKWGQPSKLLFAHEHLEWNKGGLVSNLLQVSTIRVKWAWPSEPLFAREHSAWLLRVMLIIIIGENIEDIECKKLKSTFKKIIPCNYALCISQGCNAQQIAWILVQGYSCVVAKVLDSIWTKSREWWPVILRPHCSRLCCWF